VKMVFEEERKMI